MRKLVSILALVAAFSAFGAFSSKQWLAARDDDTDAKRLQAAYADCVKQLTAPAEDISLPLETFPNGTVKSRVTAARAQIFPDTGLVWGEKIRIEQYKPDGTLAASLEAAHCLVDRKTKTGWVEGEAKIVFGESSVSGANIYLSLAREFVTIYSHPKIETRSKGFDPRSLTK